MKWKKWIGWGTGVVTLLVTSTPAVEPFAEDAASRGLVYAVEQRGTFGCGVAFADLDGDGDPDVVALGRTTPVAGVTVGVFENDGLGFFTDRSVASGIPALPAAAGVTAADWDGDGDLDLYISVWLEPNVLLRNDGGFVFTDVAGLPEMGGIDDDGAGSGCGWADIDGDGWLDLYLANRTRTNHPDPPYSMSMVPNRLFRNLGGAGFEEIGTALGVEAGIDSSFQGSFFDYDRDGDPDLYLANDKGYSTGCEYRNRMWENTGGSFTDISAKSGTDGCIDAMCIAFGDLDGNGWMDVYCSNLGSAQLEVGNYLYLNDEGEGTFTEAAAPYGVAAYEIGWGSVFFDYDHDSHLDLYVCQHLSWEPNQLFDFNGGGPAVEVAEPLGVADGDQSFTCATADVDGDGDLDLLVSDRPPALGGPQPLKLFVNHEGTSRSWVKIRVVGEAPNHHAVGAIVDVRTGDRWQMREVVAGSGFKSQDDLVLHYGLADADETDEILVSWPGGTTRTLSGYPARERWTVHPPQRLGDADGDGVVDAGDLRVLAECFGAEVTPGCETMDLDGDSVIDGDDVAAFVERYDGDLEDCNDNGVIDIEDIAVGSSVDGDGDGVPDECGAQPADVNGDGAVDVDDLLAVILAWGECGPDCPEDLDGSGEVDVDDLLAVLLGWTG